MYIYIYIYIYLYIYLLIYIYIYIISPSLIRNPPNKKPPLRGEQYFYYQFRRRHDFPPHKKPPLGGKYCYYQFRRRHYQFRRRGGFL